MSKYRFLLWLFPRDVRESFGAEMEELFERHRATHRGFARLTLWLRAGVDAIRHGLGERIDRLKCWRPAGKRWWMDILRHDLRHAWRQLVRQPAMTVAILFTLALGIGANTAVFSVVDAVLLRPLPYVEPDRLVMVWEKRPAEGVMNNSVSPADFLDWVRLNTSFTAMAGYSPATLDLTGLGEPLQLASATVSASFFDVLGVRPQVGRTFNVGEDAVGRDRVVILSHAFWQQRFGGEPTVVGRSITLDDIPHEVVGVLPRNFEFPGEVTDLWVPLSLQGGGEPPPRASHYLGVYARLKPGVSLDSARSEMDQIGQALEREHPRESRGHGAHVVTLREEIVGRARNGLLVVMSAVAFLLLIACTNVTNLLLARGSARRREMAIRAAVGAARGRLLRQALTESIFLSLLGGAAGLAVASWTLQLLVAETPAILSGAGLDRARLDPSVLAFTALICVITGLIAGALPAWHVSREEPGDPLREGGRSPVSLRRRVRFALIAGEVALTVLMLVGAGLMLRSFMRVLAQPSGIETANRLTINLTLPRSRYPDDEALKRARRALDERLSNTPGVIAAGASNLFPLTESDSRRGIIIQGQENREGPTRAHPRIVSADYFKAAGIAVQSGRSFSSSDDARSPRVVLVNATMARRYWPDQDVVGKRVMFVGETDWRQIIGVIADVKHWGLDREVNPEIYLPHEQLPSSTLTYVLHTAGDPRAFIGSAAQHVKAVDPQLPMGSVRTVEEVAAKSVAARRWSAMLLGMFAVLGLVLSAAGIYGVMAHLVSMRTGEIGIRMTLGAKPAGVLRQVLGEALAQAAIGLTLGLAAGFVVMRGLETLLFEVTAMDPIAFAGAGFAVLAVAGLAGLVPALRAMRIDPVQALRTE